MLFFAFTIFATIAKQSLQPERRLSGLNSPFRYFFDVFSLDSIQFSRFKFARTESGYGDGEIRTHDPLLARQVLSQLSYTPSLPIVIGNGLKWTRTTDLTLIRRAL